jgi:lipid II:glycine glycyltransferase (peptidoglycan interpeptide bridge formation enzyme)
VLPLFLADSIFGKRLVSTPYAVYTGIIAEEDSVRKELLNYAQQLAERKQVNYLEIREKKEKSGYNNFKSTKNVFNFSLSLSNDIDSIWKKLPKKSVRWGIKKANKSNLTWNCGNSLSDLDSFYRLFLATRKFRGVPGYPYSYFKDIIKHFNVKIYTTLLQGKAVASLFLIYHQKEVRYAFAGAVYDRGILNRQPYHLIMWKAIKDACIGGYETFNFGGATLNTNAGGLYDFKKKWSDKIVPVPAYFYLVKSKQLPGTADSVLIKIASKVWKKMPVSLIKLLSPTVIKQFV